MFCLYVLEMGEIRVVSFLLLPQIVIEMVGMCTWYCESHAERMHRDKAKY